MGIQGAGLAAAVAAMGQLQQNVAKTAERVAAGGDTLDLSAEMIALLQARGQHQALANIAQAADELAASTLSVLG